MFIYTNVISNYLQTPVNLQNKPLAFSLAEKRKVLSRPAAKRAFEFYSLGILLLHYFLLKECFWDH